MGVFLKAPYLQYSTVQRRCEIFLLNVIGRVKLTVYRLISNCFFACNKPFLTSYMALYFLSQTDLWTRYFPNVPCVLVTTTIQFLWLQQTWNNRSLDRPFDNKLLTKQVVLFCQIRVCCCKQGIFHMPFFAQIILMKHEHKFALSVIYQYWNDTSNRKFSRWKNSSQNFNFVDGLLFNVWLKILSPKFKGNLWNFEYKTSYALLKRLFQGILL